MLVYLYARYVVEPSIPLVRAYICRPRRARWFSTHFKVRPTLVMEKLLEVFNIYLNILSLRRYVIDICKNGLTPIGVSSYHEKFTCDETI